MNKDWKVTELSAVCSRIGDGVHGTPKYTPNGPYFFVNGNNIKHGFIVTNEETKKVDQTEYEAHFIDLDDSTLLMSINGTLGSLALYRGEAIILGKSAAYIKCREIDREFCYYYFQLNEVQKTLYNIATGSTIKNLSLESLKGYTVPAPPLEIQKKIAKVLSTLDAKIELNNWINGELEGMAKLLYDYWFVQFEFPITAEQAAAMSQPQLEGKPYKTSGGKMVYNQELKREIPEGWEVTELSDIAEITMGQSPPGKSYNGDGDGEVFFQGSTDFGWRFPSPRQHTTSPTRFAQTGDILLSVRAPVGTLNIAPERCAIGRGLAAIRSKGGCNSHLFNVMAFFKQVFDRRNRDGTTFGSITKTDLFSLKLPIPTNDLIPIFEKTASQNTSIIFVNHQQNQHLIQLRDWLLPMLMNGQVTVE